MIRCKSSVRFKILRKEIWSLFAGIEGIFAVFNVEPVISCGTEAHAEKDPHTHGFAIDIRSKNLKSEYKEIVLQALKRLCGPRYFVVLESVGKPQEHYHIQLRKHIWPTLI